MTARVDNLERGKQVLGCGSATNLWILIISNIHGRSQYHAYETSVLWHFVHNKARLKNAGSSAQVRVMVEWNACWSRRSVKVGNNDWWKNAHTSWTNPLATDQPITGQDSLSSRRNRQWKQNLHGITCSSSVGSFGNELQGGETPNV